MMVLTDAQVQALQLAADGKDIAGAALVMGTTYSTIRQHRSAIIRRLDAETFEHAIALAFRAGVVR
jgi:DNA-binding CsgD family transcriptional regulator